MAKRAGKVKAFERIFCPAHGVICAETPSQAHISREIRLSKTDAENWSNKQTAEVCQWDSSICMGERKCRCFKSKPCIRTKSGERKGSQYKEERGKWRKKGQRATPEAL